jgi:hypothetical protein
VEPFLHLQREITALFRKSHLHAPRATEINRPIPEIKNIQRDFSFDMNFYDVFPVNISQFDDIIFEQIH